MLPAIMITNALLNAYYTSIQQETPANFKEKLGALYLSDEPFLKKIKQLDLLIEEFKLQDDVGELVFDVLLYNFFSEDSQRLGESFFESKEWEQIESSIIERGTEMMNLMLYLSECNDSNIESSLDDYLDEYLTGEEDFDTEEFEVYEAIIKNRDAIVEGDLQTIVEIAEKNSNSMLFDQLLPIMVFFETQSEVDEKFETIRQSGTNPSFQNAFLAVLLELNKIKVNLN
jgi:hypothetical protein